MFAAEPEARSETPVGQPLLVRRTWSNPARRDLRTLCAPRDKTEVKLNAAMQEATVQGFPRARSRETTSPKHKQGRSHESTSRAELFCKPINSCWISKNPTQQRQVSAESRECRARIAKKGGSALTPIPSLCVLFRAPSFCPASSTSHQPPGPTFPACGISRRFPPCRSLLLGKTVRRVPKVRSVQGP